LHWAMASDFSVVWQFSCPEQLFFPTSISDYETPRQVFTPVKQIGVCLGLYKPINH
jgi:hypothetical protein